LVGSNAEDAIDRLRGANSNATFELDATFKGNDIWNKYFLNQDEFRKLLFNDFEILLGGSRDDTFIIAGEQRYDLYGEAGNDTFVFADGAKLLSYGKGNGSGQFGNIDGGSGNNILDYSAYTTSRNFYLTALGSITGFNGREQSIAGEFWNITNIIGGEATDSLSGLNEANTWEVSGENSGSYRTSNRILTFSGIDTLNGGAFNDHFVIKEGASLSGHIDGRSGTDTLDYSAYLKNIYVDLKADLASQIAKGISSIENVTGGPGNDTIIGDDKDNVLAGGPGDDIIYGGGGNDIIDGGDGNDIIYGGSGDDTIYGGNGDDIIYAGAGDDTIYGDAGNDKLYGEEGNDTIDGGSGNDYLDGGDGDDRLHSGSGHNILIGGPGNDTAVIAYGSSYEVPDGDIENWIFLPPPREPESPSSSSGDRRTAAEEEYKQNISRITGGIISFQGIIINIPPLTLPDDATISIKILVPENVKEMALLTGGIDKLCSKVIEITTSGRRQFGKDNFIEIRIPFDLQKVAFGESPVVHYFDPELGKWVPLKTVIEYDQVTGQYYAVVKVNHLTMFAVLSTAVEEKVINLKIGEATIIVDGNPYSLPGTPYLDHTVGRTLLPIRSICEAMGAELEWLEAEQQVIIRKDDSKIVLTIGSREALVNNKLYSIDTAPVLQAPGVTYAPVRFIAEALGAKVDYNGIIKEITITFASIPVIKQLKLDTEPELNFANWGKYRK
jgi:Ca2+-binding RTX toxin-like protein